MSNAGLLIDGYSLHAISERKGCR